MYTTYNSCAPMQSCPKYTYVPQMQYPYTGTGIPYAVPIIYPVMGVSGAPYTVPAQYPVMGGVPYTAPGQYPYAGTQWMGTPYVPGEFQAPMGQFPAVAGQYAAPPAPVTPGMTRDAGDDDEGYDMEFDDDQYRIAPYGRRPVWRPRPYYPPHFYRPRPFFPPFLPPYYPPFFFFF